MVSTSRRKRSSANDQSLGEWYNGLRSDYNMHRQGRFRRRRKGLAYSGSGSDFHYRSDADYLRMIEIARDMDRNDSILGQGVDRLVANVIQDGFTLDTKTGDDKVDDELTARWKEWSEDPDQVDVAGERTFSEMEQDNFRAPIIDGDIWTILPTDLPQMEMMEAHRVRTPRNTKKNVVHGVLLNRFRRREEIWVTRDDIDPGRSLAKVSDVRQIPVRDAEGNRQVLQNYFPKRMSQTRGITAAAPIADLLGMYDDIQFAKLVQQQVVSCFAIIRERVEGYEGGDPEKTGASSSQTLSDGSARSLEGIGPGMQIMAELGEKITGFSPNVPNSEYFQHCTLILSVIAINLKLPLAVLMLDPSNTNFSGWRGAMDQARMQFRQMQKRSVNRFNRPVYLWKVRQWMREDPALARHALRDGVNIFGHKWHRPTWQYIEPLKDASGDLLTMSNGLNSPRRVQALRSRDYDEISSETIEDNASHTERAIKAAIKLNGKYGERMKKHGMTRVDWREIAARPLAQGFTIALDGASDGPSDDSQSKKQEPKEAVGV